MLMKSRRDWSSKEAFRRLCRMPSVIRWTTNMYKTRPVQVRGHTSKSARVIQDNRKIIGVNCRSVAVNVSRVDVHRDTLFLSPNSRVYSAISAPEGTDRERIAQSSIIRKKRAWAPTVRRQNEDMLREARDFSQSCGATGVPRSDFSLVLPLEVTGTPRCISLRWMARDGPWEHWIFSTKSRLLPGSWNGESGKTNQLIR